MPTLHDYKKFADTEYERQLIISQNTEILRSNVVTCDCGHRGAFYNMWRCYYCGIWFCETCAAVHFGQTIAEWRTKQDVKKQTNTLLGKA